MIITTGMIKRIQKDVEQLRVILESKLHELSVGDKIINKENYILEILEIREEDYKNIKCRPLCIHKILAYYGVDDLAKMGYRKLEESYYKRQVGEEEKQSGDKITLPIYI